MRERRLRAAIPTYVATVWLLVCAACFGIPRPVDATTTGGGDFKVTVTLPTFPCYIGCGGTAAGTAELSLSGIGTAAISGAPIPYTAVWSLTVSTLSAGFTYSDTCELGQPGNTPPLSGDADGGFTLSGGSVALGGGVLRGAMLTGAIHITRIADAVRIALFNLVITPPAGSPTIAVNLTGAIDGQSTAGLVWTNGPGTCATQVSNQTALVVGVIVQPV